MKKYTPFELELSKLAKISNTPNLIEQLQHQEQFGNVVVFSDPSVGFVALKLIKRNEQSVLFVWVAISRTKQAITTAFPMIEQTAAETGCAFIEFETTHKGFKRIAKRIGFELVGKRDIFTIYRKRVQL